jgi:hypothetical protein
MRTQYFDLAPQDTTRTINTIDTAQDRTLLIYTTDLYSEESKDFFTKGRLHALHYPVEPTGLLIPWNATENMLTGEGQNLLTRLVKSAAREFSGFSSMDDVTRWVGLYDYPPKQEQGANPYDMSSMETANLIR